MITRTLTQPARFATTSMWRGMQRRRQRDRGGMRLARINGSWCFVSMTRVDDPSGPGRGIGAVPFVGPNGEVYVAWNDYRNNVIAFNRSFDGGVSWDAQRTIAARHWRSIWEFRPSHSGSAGISSMRRGSFDGSAPWAAVLSWMDLTPAGTTDIYLTFSDDRGSTWSTPRAVTDQFSQPVDRFNLGFPRTR